MYFYNFAFPEESICDVLRTRRELHLIHIEASKYLNQKENKTVFRKDRGIQKRTQIVDRRFVNKQVNPTSFLTWTSLGVDVDEDVLVPQLSHVRLDLRHGRQPLLPQLALSHRHAPHLVDFLLRDPKQGCEKLIQFMQFNLRNRGNHYSPGPN